MGRPVWIAGVARGIRSTSSTHGSLRPPSTRRRTDRSPRDRVVHRGGHDLPVLAANGAQRPHVVIGNYCSIGARVTFLVNGDHRTDWTSTYPLRHVGAPRGTVQDGHPRVSGPITIGHDVWIGFGAILLGGITNRTRRGGPAPAQSSVDRSLRTPSWWATRRRCAGTDSIRRRWSVSFVFACGVGPCSGRPTRGPRERPAGHRSPRGCRERGAPVGWARAVRHRLAVNPVPVVVVHWRNHAGCRETVASLSEQSVVGDIPRRRQQR